MKMLMWMVGFIICLLLPILFVPYFIYAAYKLWSWVIEKVIAAGAILAIKSMLDMDAEELLQTRVEFEEFVAKYKDGSITKYILSDHKPGVDQFLKK